MTVCGYIQSPRTRGTESDFLSRSKEVQLSTLPLWSRHREVLYFIEYRGAVSFNV